MKSSEVRKEWSQLLNSVFKGQTRIVVEKSGIPVAAVISAEDLEKFTQLENIRKERFKALDKIREAFKDVPAEELEQEIDKAVSKVRKENTNKK